MDERAVWLARKNGDPASSVTGFTPPSSTEGPLQTVREQERVGTVSLIEIAHFWPVELLKETLGIEVNKAEIVDGVDGFGKQCKGVNRSPEDDPEILPRRVHVLKEQRVKDAVHDILWNRSDQDVRENQGTDALAFVKSRCTLEFQDDTTATGDKIKHLCSKVSDDGQTCGPPGCTTQVRALSQ